MKKVIAALIALCLVLSMGTVAFAAEDKATLEVSSVSDIYDFETEEGDTLKLIDVTFALNNMDALAAATNEENGGNDGTLGGLQFDFTYDSAVMNFVEAVATIEHSYKAGLSTKKFMYDTSASEVAAADGKTTMRAIINNGNMDCKLGIEIKGDRDVMKATFIVADGVEAGTKTNITIEGVVAGDSAQHDSKHATPYQDLIEVGNTDVTVGAKAEESSEESIESSEESKEESKDESTDESKEESKDEATSSTDKPATSSDKPATSNGGNTSKPGTTAPKTGDAGILAVGALMVVAAGAAFVTMKKR